VEAKRSTAWRLKSRRAARRPSVGPCGENSPGLDQPPCKVQPKGDE
jgi:hypothetical protein